MKKLVIIKYTNLQNYALPSFLKGFSENFPKNKKNEYKMVYFTKYGKHPRSFLLEIFYVAELYEWNIVTWYIDEIRVKTLLSMLI